MQVEKKNRGPLQLLVDFLCLALFPALVLGLMFASLYLWRVLGSGAGFGGGLIGGFCGVLVFAAYGKVLYRNDKRRIEESGYVFKNGCWFVVQEDSAGFRRRVGVPWPELGLAVDDLKWYREQGYKSCSLGGGVDFEIDSQSETMGYPRKG